MAEPAEPVLELARAVQTLALLNEQAAQVRAELLALRKELAHTRLEFTSTRAAHLLEANERLVLAALEAEAVADTVRGELDSLAQASQRDALTDLPNRPLMLDRMESAIAMARRRGSSIAVLFIDVDSFKPINDSLGHAVGDEVLKSVARRLSAVVRHSDTVSRHGGDEFLVLLADIAQGADAGVIAAKMLAGLAKARRVGGHALRVAASIGIAVFPDDGEDAATLVRHADAAMYHAKRLGGGRYRFFEKPS